MPKKKVTVQVSGSGILQDDVLMLGASLLKQWKIPAGHPLQLAFGAFRQEVTVISVPKYDGMRIGQVLSRKTGISSGSVLRIKYSPRSRILHIGPLISVMISRDYPDQPDRPFGSITLFCRELVSACRQQGGAVYFFTPDDIENAQDRVQGWVYDNGWKKRVMPVADVVNNRLTSRKLENKPSVQHFLREVKSRHGTAVFNEKFLDKNEVFDALRSKTSLLRFMPDSHLLKNLSQFKKMCSAHPVLFLKPVRGSLGKGIIRVTRNPDGSYQTLATNVGGTRKQVYPNVTKLFEGISGKMKSTRYQIQQGVNLIENGQRPVDFRALVQKNSTGKWSVTSIVARIAGGSHYVSNLARGGSLSTVREAVAKSSLSPAAKSAAPGKLQTAALEIAAGIEEAIPAHFGELGIDLAIDTTGHVWLIEVNSKPSKNDNTPLNDSKTRPSVKKMLDYSGFLAGF
ncbi:YheC/YheD family protein [Paenibacillus sp. JX-17]|uniref:YheC/YheD family protein n=1 Tax=Paenibacillus lacisoli TaxID=3064525 RepID=A0ABT9CA44_9BACL|nr:YheC/YheD family protein [Paenibacillus sp. JX-17]MDO7906126.1 YheC/YheD family protein [Paenibacillus sp. JX-17]